MQYINSFTPGQIKDEELRRVVELASNQFRRLDFTINERDLMASKPWVDVRTHGAKPEDASRDDTVAVQAAINAEQTIVFPPGTYRQGTTTPWTIPSGRTLIFMEGAKVKLGDAAGSSGGGKQIFTNADWVNGNSNITIIHPEIDGNKANNSGRNAHGLDFRGVDNLRIVRPIIYNLPDAGSLLCGDGIYLGRASGGTHNDYMEITGGKISGCMRNGLSIIDARWSSFQGTVFESNYHAGIDIEPNSSTDRLVQLGFNNINIVLSSRYGMVIKNTASAGYGGLCFSNLTIETCQREGLYIHTMSWLQFNNLETRNNSQAGDASYSGIALVDSTYNVLTNVLSTGSWQDYGIEEYGSSDYNIYNALSLAGNSTTSNAQHLLLVGGNSRCYNNIDGVSLSVASAGTITLNPSGEFFIITGTTNITSVTASWPGRRVVLRFADILTFTDGSNLKLAGNFVTTADDTIALVCDGTNWIEESRSVN